MAGNQKSIPTKINLDLAPEYFDGNTARFIKNLTSYVGATNENGQLTEGKNIGKQKPHLSNELYVDFEVPEGENSMCGGYSSAETNEVFVCIHNSLKNHFIYRINGNTRMVDVVYRGSELNFILSPENFIATGNAWLEVVYLTDPATGDTIRRTFFFFTDAENYQRHIAVEDSIATNSFDKTLYPYFNGDYEKEVLINMGLPTPKTCIEVTEIERTEEDYGLLNNLLFQTWQFRVMATDVWGRMSEHSIISDLYVPGINDCFSSSPNLPRCLNLKFDAGIPIINKYQIEFRNCNDSQWYVDSVINLYEGSSIGNWWLRKRNPEIDYDAATNTINYTFCRTREKNAISPTQTNRLFNPLPRQSQALTKVGEAIGLFNNKEGFIPLPKSTKDLITFDVEPPEASQVLPIRNITILVPIYNEEEHKYTSVFLDHDGVSGYLFGDENHQPRTYSQYFSNKQQSGFGGYLLGSGTVAFSTQVYLDADNRLVDDPEHKGQSISPSHRTFQKFVFNGVPAGVYIFRLFSHLTDLSVTSEYMSTSTTVYGRCAFNPANYSVDTGHRDASKELIVDVCDEDYDTLKDDKILVIADLASDNQRAVCGYVYETNSNGFNQNPVELMNVTNPASEVSLITDHNGFYYYGTHQNGRTFYFGYKAKCAKNQITFGSPLDQTMQFKNRYLEDYNHDFIIVPCNRVLVKGRVVLKDKNIGVPNVSVTLTRGGSAISDDNGYYTIIAHDEYTTDTRHDEVVLSGSTCNYFSEDGCIHPIPVSIPPCSACIERVVEVEDFVLTYNSQRSLLSGGTYASGATVWDGAGRGTYLQDLVYITIPTITKSQAIGASKIKVSINPNIRFPSYFKYLTLFITEELTIDTYVSWIVDRAEFVDNSGKINNVSPTQIKIYYESLNEYNKQNNFNTTTNWQFIAPAAGGENQLAYQSDIVQFYMNGDGLFFDKLITALVKYDQEGQYFLIDYTEDLKDLKQNALIRLVRPKTITSDTQPYFEICHIIDIVNGVPTETEFYLNAFDTYYLNRQIPVPSPVTPTPTITQISTTTGDTTVYETPVPVSQAIELRVFGFPFEHDSPSNFWGKGCKNIGRINIKNPYETEVFSMHDGILSGALSKTGQLNYLNYFSDANRVTFNIPNVGGITAALYEMGMLAIICQYDNFVVGFNDNLARVDANGNIQVPSGSNNFGKPERKIGNNYGCQFHDKNTIIKRNGVISFVDSNKGELVQFNYSNIVSYTKGQCDSYFRNKVKVIQADRNKYFIGGVDPITNNYLLTDFSLENKTYINDLREENPAVCETLSFDMATRELKEFLGFTPEGYGMLDGDLLNVQLFTFKGGLPYSHYNVKNNNSYNKFYGVQCEKVFRVIFNLGGDTKKFFLSIAVYCQNENYFSDKVLTDSKQESRILLSAWSKGDYFYVAPFNCDLKSVADINLKDETGINKLMDGDKLYGSYVDVRLVGEPAKSEQYSELLDARVVIFPQSNTGDA